MVDNGAWINLVKMAEPYNLDFFVSSFIWPLYKKGEESNPQELSSSFVAEYC